MQQKCYRTIKENQKKITKQSGKIQEHSTFNKLDSHCSTYYTNGIYSQLIITLHEVNNSNTYECYMDILDFFIVALLYSFSVTACMSIYFFFSKNYVYYRLNRVLTSGVLAKCTNNQMGQ